LQVKDWKQGIDPTKRKVVGEGGRRIAPTPSWGPDGGGRDAQHVRRRNDVVGPESNASGQCAGQGHENGRAARSGARSAVDAREASREHAAAEESPELALDEDGQPVAVAGVDGAQRFEVIARPREGSSGCYPAVDRGRRARRHGTPSGMPTAADAGSAG